MTVGLAMVIPAAAIALAVLLRHPRAAGAGRDDAAAQRTAPMAWEQVSAEGATLPA